MGIRDYPWEPSYATSDLRDDGSEVDVLHDFYIPALERATHYDRVAGFFTSSSLAAASQGFSRFVQNGGKARFIVGMQVDPEDAAAILQGDQYRAAKVLLPAVDVSAEWPENLRHGVELLAWMVAHDHLSIRVGLRVHRKTGEPQSPEFSQDGYLHEKWAIIGDDSDELFVSGSLNESRTALSINAENIDIHPSWEAWNAQRLRRKHSNFEALWSGQHPAIHTFSVPQAVQKRLLEVAKGVRRLFEIDGTSVPLPLDEEVPVDGVREVIGEPRPSWGERLRFAMLRLAPLLPGGERVGVETTPIEPWPHQRFVVNRLLATYPRNHLLCDEVGLGKTIEAGLTFRALWLSGRVGSIRVFAPASLTSQWLVEMAEKFYLPFVRRTSRQGRWEKVDLRSGEKVVGDGQMFDEPLEIISTGLVINRRGVRLLKSFPETDIVLVDEAHKARRQTPDNQQQLPRFNKLYQELRDALYSHSRSLLLATATPMQLNRVEAFDLLKFMPSAGAVQFSEDLSEIFYKLRERLLDGEVLEDYEAEWLKRYLHDARVSSPEHWAFVMEHVLDTFGNTGLADFVDAGIDPMDWNDVQPALSLLAPLGRSMLRHTRSLLRIYQAEGLLNANLAWRDVHAEIIPLKGVEREIYDQLQDYCSELASKVAENMEGGKQRAAVGFYLSFLRLRYASSFHALRCSLERRQKKIRLTLEQKAQQFVDGSVDREDLEEMADEEVEGLVLKHRKESDLTWEQGAVDGLLRTLDRLTSTPQKVKRLLEHIEARRRNDRVRQLVLFTRYTDTLKYLHSELCRLLPGCPIGTFSGVGATVRSPGEPKPETLDRTSIKQRFVAGEIDILLCTDAAAEGLNLQSANLLINFDLPWNPMLLEQRIGRIDRIGQHHTRIHVVNYLYQGSVEEVVYSRLVDRFRGALQVSGELQFSLLPIQPEDFEDLAKAEGEAGRIDEQELYARARKNIKRIQERQRLTEFEASQQKVAYEALEKEVRDEPLPASLDDIWRVITESKYLHDLGGRIETFLHGEAYCLVDIPNMREEVLLTTSRELFEHGLGKDDERPLHFATFGDPVFEHLVSHMLEPMDEVNECWRRGQAMASVTVDGKALSTVAEACALNPDDEPVLELNSRPSTSARPQSDQIGAAQRMALARAAASLAEQKLKNSDDTPGTQIGEIERFIRDVERRPARAAELLFDVPDRTGILAAKSRLLWEVYARREKLALKADPLFLHAARNMILRVLGERDCRNNRAVSRRLREDARL